MRSGENTPELLVLLFEFFVIFVTLVIFVMSRRPV